MLPPITRKYSDRSTPAYFAFVFFCDTCGAPWQSERYPFSLTNDPPISEAESEARRILWKAEHDAAYERANTEAIKNFNKCRRCGSRVCDRCLCELDDICIPCAEGTPPGSTLQEEE